ncbi:hypothetical protein [Pseudomonas sp.]|uniref:hypothetical protein n=1 Tax=Pseudomonas sp. TaxID=306 RepID=UPI002353FA8F|nr:hypothetical protein [Pseudomonas sp.]
MSHAPRPYSLLSRTVGEKGSDAQAWLVTGTTSVWPDKTNPPVVDPSHAGTVANKLALRPSRS